MLSCKICGKAIDLEDFEGESEFCTDCIIEGSKKYGLKTVSLLLLLFVDGVFFIASLLNIFGIIFFYQEGFIFLTYIVPICLATGGVFLSFIFVSKFKTSKRHQLAISNT